MGRISIFSRYYKKTLNWSYMLNFSFVSFITHNGLKFMSIFSLNVKMCQVQGGKQCGYDDETKCKISKILIHTHTKKRAVQATG